MAETIQGTVTRTYHSSPDFSAGVLKSVDGRTVRFCGKFCANDGDIVALVGTWRIDRKYGHQFVVESLSYELPETTDGLVQYLAKNPAFRGIGEATARRIVEYAGSAERLDRLIREQPDELRAGASVPGDTLKHLCETWAANAEENAVRSYLSSYGLTHSQMTTLLDRFGTSVVSVLKHDPYELIKHVKGYGFKKVDKIARALGVAKDHPGRIEAAIQYCVDEQINDGHTWTAGSDLLDQANDVLVLDGLDSLELIQAAGNRLLERGSLIAEDCAVTVPWVHQAERTIREALVSHAWSEARFVGADADEDGLRRGQVEAYRTALRYRISVISGGAGTGKTFIVARLANTFRRAGLSTRLCAPTGKAAQRIEQLLREHGLDLEASTIHRMLRYDGRSFGVDQVDADVVIVDEVSMVDVPLMAALLERIDHRRTRLILVGDHNQLPPVGPGNVLRDLIQHELAPVTVLDEVVRQAGVLKVNSMAVLAGRVAPSEPDGHAWSVIDCFRDAQQIQVYLRELVLERIPQRLAFDPVQDVQIITPTHLGALGTKAVNGMMQHALHGEVGRKFAVGDKVIQTVNNYDLDVMNGTIGVVREAGKDGYVIDFEGVGPVDIGPDHVPAVHLAYALTAHKAQGSEFPCAVVLCHKSHYFADRNWLYTAATRAAKTCILLGDAWGLRNAAKKNQTIRRRTFLSLWATSADRTSAAQEVAACP